MAKAVATTKRHQAWIDQYASGSAELLAWVQRTASEHAGGDRGETSEAVKAKLDAPVLSLQRTFLDWTPCFPTATAWIFIPAYCCAVP